MWGETDGQYAQMLLCDQFSRNSFRGTAEAFAYDERGVELARELFKNKVYETYEVGPSAFMPPIHKVVAHIAGRMWPSIT